MHRYTDLRFFNWSSVGLRYCWYFESIRSPTNFRFCIYNVPTSKSLIVHHQSPWCSLPSSFYPFPHPIHSGCFSSIASLNIVQLLWHLKIYSNHCLWFLAKEKKCIIILLTPQRQSKIHWSILQRIPCFLYFHLLIITSQFHTFSFVQPMMIQNGRPSYMPDCFFGHQNTKLW